MWWSVPMGRRRGAGFRGQARAGFRGASWADCRICATGPQASLRPRSGFSRGGRVAESMIAAVGVVGQDLVDLLGEERFAAMGDERLRAGVGQAASEVSEIAKPLVEVADGEQTGVRDDSGGVEGNGDRLPMDLGEGKVRGVTRRHKQQASVYRQVVGSSPLEIRARPRLPTPCAQSGLVKSSSVR